MTMAIEPGRCGCSGNDARATTDELGAVLHGFRVRQEGENR